MKTLAAWIKANPGVNALAFERNADKCFGFGACEEVCGFCLASHYFDGEAPILCKFCRAPLRETHVISNLPEIANRVHSLEHFLGASTQRHPQLPFIIFRNPAGKP